MMKPTHFSRYLKFALFLAILSSFTTASAYDFQSDGIYYNITSTNTVEVTYKDNNYASYNGDVIIPSTVTRNAKTYTVLAIGDKAFYNSSVSNVTIPETITSIGDSALCKCHELISITTLATTPPVLHNSFDFRWSDYYPDLWGYDPNSWKTPTHVLYVGSEEMLSDYLNSSWSNNISNIIILGLQSYPPGFYLRERCGNASYPDYVTSAYIYLIGGEESFISYNGRDYTKFDSDDIGLVAYLSRYETDPCITLYAYTIEYGKQPSEVVDFSYCLPPDNPDDPDNPYYPFSKVYYTYDFVVDGICYRTINNNSVQVVPDCKLIIDYYDVDLCYPHVSERMGYNTGNIIIPDVISYEGKSYSVSSIGKSAFGGLFYDPYGTYCWDYYDIGLIEEIENSGLTSIIIPNSLTYIDSYAFYNCSTLTNVTIPNSIKTINNGLIVNDNEYYSPFDGCNNLNLIYLTGNGEWKLIKNNEYEFDGLYVSVPRLDIARGITAIPGLQVNPREVYSYAAVPPTCDENTFTDYTGTLHVPESSLAAYFTAPYWCNFMNIVGDAVELTDLTLNKVSAELLVDEQLTLNATIQPANASIDSITWSSSNEEIATVVNGVVTTKALGECDIIVTCLDKRAVCHIKVVEQVTTITLDQHHASLLPNHILTLTPTVTPEPTDLVVTSSNPSVAAARLANGKVQVVGVSVGNAIIKVSSADGKAVADSCFVNVYTEAGDVDGDGFVKIDDVTCLIDYLLSGDASSIDLGNADFDFDGNVSISDVTALIDCLLSGTSMSTRETFTVNGVSFTMIRVPAGSFMMGATEEQGSEANSWERPVHEVTLSSSYLIGETEVTQELWLAVMGTNPSKHEGSLQKPVENVSWLDCQEFIAQLNALTGCNFRMPTEAEWEYAARGANRSRGYKYAGSDDIADVGNVSSSTTLPVGSLQPNELNIYDMSGNVDEWVWDYFGYYTSEPQTDPTGPEEGSDHMYRGGSWYSGANVARVSYRFFRASTFKRGTMGLRLAL